LESAEPEYRALYQDYEARTSLEARLVKGCGRYHLLVQAYALERSGQKGLMSFGK